MARTKEEERKRDSGKQKAGRRKEHIRNENNVGAKVLRQRHLPWGRTTSSWHLWD